MTAGLLSLFPWRDLTNTLEGVPNEETSEEVVGFDRTRLEKYLGRVAGVHRPFRWQSLRGGHSNLTYLVSDRDGRELVVRRPPGGDLQPKAHDMSREYRLIEALWATDVPVPQPIAYCDDPAVCSAPFYVMGKSEGRALLNEPGSGTWLEEIARRRAGRALAQTLATLHSISPESIGLAGIGRPDGYVERQLKSWYASWVTHSRQVGLDDRRVHALHDLLSDHVPRQGPASLVHGDFGPHNVLFHASGEVSAVLDWEIATLGAPLADLAYAINAWVGPSDDPMGIANPATALPGFDSREEVLRSYVAVSRADISDLAYYRSFNLWKRACILQGVYARYATGQKSSDGVDIDVLRGRIDDSIAGAVRLADTSAGLVGH